MKTIKAKVHRLPTEVKAKDWRQQIVVLKDGTGLSVNNTENHQNKTEILSLLDATCIPQHLYITTDEEIKEGDWYYDGGYEQLIQYGVQEGIITTECKKIIATTDPKLTPNGTTEFGAEQDILMMPQIPQSFIEEYCKAGGIDEVLVEGEEIILPLATSNKKSWEVESSEFRPKLNPDNTIIIHPVQEKMYSREEVIKLCEDAFRAGIEYTYGVIHEVVDKWIEENL